MIKTIDLVPSSIREDFQVRAACEAIDIELEEIYEEIPEVAFWTRLDKVESPLLDVLLWEYHVDWTQNLVDGAPLTDEAKREAIDRSIVWHQKKGTKWAVEQVLRTAWPSATVVEWFRYVGRPFFFRIAIEEDVASDPVLYARINEAVMVTKNARSWLEGFVRLLESRGEIGVAGTCMRRKRVKIRAYTIWDTPGLAIAGVTPVWSNPHQPVRLDLTGFSFSSSCVIMLDGVELATTLVDPFILQSEEFDSGDEGVRKVQIYNEATREESNIVEFVVEARLEIDIVIGRIIPETAFEQTDIRLVVDGEGFDETSVIVFAGVDIDTLFVSENRIQSIDRFNVGGEGIKAVKVTTLLGESNQVIFAVLGRPFIFRIDPDIGEAGSIVTMDIIGRNLTPTGVVHFDGAPIDSIFIDSNRVQTEPFNVGAQVRDVEVQLIDSSSDNLVLTHIEPDTAKASSDITLEAYGTGFTPNSQIQFAGVPRTTVFHDIDHITAEFNIGPQIGNRTVRIVEIDKEDSNTLTFVTTLDRILHIDRISPTKGVINTQVSVDIYGRDFGPNTQVYYFNNGGRNRVVHDDTHITATFGVGAGIAERIVYVYEGDVNNPELESNRVMFSARAPLVLARVDPNPVQQGQRIFHYHGSGFTPETVPWFRNSDRLEDSTFVDSTHIILPQFGTGAPPASTNYVDAHLEEEELPNSNSIDVYVNGNNQLLVTSIEPGTVDAGTTIELRVHGLNFAAATVIWYNNAAQTTTFVNNTEVRANIQVGWEEHDVWVVETNKRDGNKIPLKLNPRVLVLERIEPERVTANTQMVLHCYGRGFSPNSVIWARANARTTIFVDSTHLYTASYTSAAPQDQVNSHVREAGLANSNVIFYEVY